jgi:hypothetical protein
MTHLLIEESAVHARVVNVVGQTAGQADNYWEQFKGGIIPPSTVSDYVKTLPESIQQKLIEQNGLWYKDKQVCSGAKRRESTASDYSCTLIITPCQQVILG